MALQERTRATVRRKAASPLRPGGISTWLPAALAVAALLVALVAAVGPADAVHASYAWPPRTSAATQQPKLWYTPLLLTRHEPESLSATIPCDVRGLDGAADSTLVLATTRTSAGLAVYRTGDRLVVRLDGARLVDAPVGRSPAGCSFRLDLRGSSWSLTGGPSDIHTNGALGHMPFVAGLFSAANLKSSPGFAVQVAALVRDVRPRIVQELLWVVSIVAALAALLLALRPLTIHAGRLRIRPSLQDGVIVALLFVWWIVGPAFFDDGWVAARQQNYDAAGGFSAYYSSFGVNLPLDYWVEWLEHWLSLATNALVLQRLPALACLLATWFVCRWTLGRVVRRPIGAAVQWALAAAFAVGALAWGMTFRPEPIVALLVAAVVGLTLAFVQSGSSAALAGALLVGVLALTAHPAGIVALAPLLAAAPAIATWARAHVRVAATLLTSCIAVLVVLAALGSDLHQRRADVASLRAFGDETAGWRDELTRYQLLSQAPYSTPVRRAAVGLILLAVLTYLLRRRGREQPLLGFPARALGLSLMLFLLTPTKWPWHFGVLIGLAAVAVAAETARLRDDARAMPGWQLRPFLAIAGVVALAGWAWSPRTAWGELDLRNVDWTLGFEERLTLSKLGGALPVVLLVVLALCVSVRHRRRELSRVPWGAALWSIPLVAASVIAFTVGVLLNDAAKTNGWTLTRQNMDALKGSAGCGLADDAVVPTRASMRPLAEIAAGRAGRPAVWLPPTPLAGVTPLTLKPGGTSGWYRLRPGAGIGFFLAAPPSAGESLRIEWSRRGLAGTTALGSTGAAQDVATDTRPDLAYWRFYGTGDVGRAPQSANAVRFVLRMGARPGTEIGVTPPVTYADEPLTTTLERSKPALALPDLLPYVPCVRQPRVSERAEMPGAILARRTTMWPIGAGTSPFDGITSVYPLVRLPLSDSPDPPADVALYEVDRNIDGWRLTPATVRRTGT